MIMNRRVLIPALFLAGAAGLAGCTNPPGTVSPTPTTTTTPALTCPAGSWRSTGVAATTSVGTVPVTLTGGADVKATIGADGAVTADFTGMKPVVYTATVAGSEVAGEFTYTGSVSATVAVTGATATSSTGTATSTGTSPATSSTTSSGSGSATAGSPWRPTGQVNWGGVKLTAKLTKPVVLTPIDNVKLTDVTGAQTTQIGNVVDLQPLLRAGEYRCTGNDALVITPSASGGPTVAWTFARV
jgi:hypothetical protein